MIKICTDMAFIYNLYFILYPYIIQIQYCTRLLYLNDYDNDMYWYGV